MVSFVSYGQSYLFYIPSMCLVQCGLHLTCSSTRTLNVFVHTLVRVDILDISSLPVADCKPSLEVSLLQASADCRNSFVISTGFERMCYSIINDHDVLCTPYPQYQLVAFQEV